VRQGGIAKPHNDRVHRKYIEPVKDNQTSKQVVNLSICVFDGTGGTIQNIIESQSQVPTTNS